MWTDFKVWCLNIAKKGGYNFDDKLHFLKIWSAYSMIRQTFLINNRQSSTGSVAQYWDERIVNEEELWKKLKIKIKIEIWLKLYYEMDRERSRLKFWSKLIWPQMKMVHMTWLQPIKRHLKNKFRQNLHLLNLYEYHIFRAFSAGRVSTPTLHQSARDVVSEMVMQQMSLMRSLMGKRLRVMGRMMGRMSGRMMRRMMGRLTRWMMGTRLRMMTRVTRGGKE